MKNREAASQIGLSEEESPLVVGPRKPRPAKAVKAIEGLDRLQFFLRRDSIPTPRPPPSEDPFSERERAVMVALGRFLPGLRRFGGSRLAGPPPRAVAKLASIAKIPRRSCDAAIRDLLKRDWRPRYVRHDEETVLPSSRHILPGREFMLLRPATSRVVTRYMEIDPLTGEHLGRTLPRGGGYGIDVRDLPPGAKIGRDRYPRGPNTDGWAWTLKEMRERRMWHLDPKKWDRALAGLIEACGKCQGCGSALPRAAGSRVRSKWCSPACCATARQK